VNDWQDFQGIWRAVSLTDDGRKRTAEEVRVTRGRISTDRYTLHLGGCEFHGTITDVEPGKDRGAVDFVADEGQGGGGRRFLGLYVLEGDEFTVCVAPPGKERPTTFECRPGSGHRLYLLRRLTPSRVRPADEALR
jgi:uncharacterized protein (TIGR03067 family)